MSEPSLGETLLDHGLSRCDLCETWTQYQELVLRKVDEGETVWVCPPCAIDMEKQLWDEGNWKARDTE